MDNLAENFKNLCGQLGVTEYEMGKRMGLPRPDKLYQVSRGTTKDPRISILYDVKTYFPEVDLNAFLLGDMENVIIKSPKKLEQRIKELEEEIESNKMRSENKILRLVLTDEQKKIVGSFNTRVPRVQCRVIPFHPIYDENKKTA
jgi:hypothetical protein